jgi:tetratricopeptide (TPR) repeat protein
VAKAAIKVKKKKVKITARDLKHDAFRDHYERFATWAKHHRRQIIRTAIGLLALLVLVTGTALFTTSRREGAEKALAEAYEIFTAEVTSTSSSSDPTRRTYSSEEQKYREALEAFTRLAQKYPSYRDVAEYYAALCKLHLNRSEGARDLERLAQGKGETARLARLALAEHLLASGDPAGAERQYRQLLEDPGELPQAPLKLGLARALEFQGKKVEAVELYVKIATDYRAQDAGRTARERLAALDPSALERVPEEGTSPS